MNEYLEIGHVGNILRADFMEPLGLSMNALATAIGIPVSCIHGILHGTRGITANTDLRLTRYFGLTQGYFLRMQARYDMLRARRNISRADLDKIIPIIPTRTQSNHPRMAA